MPTWEVSRIDLEASNRVKIVFSLDMKQSDGIDLDDTLLIDNYALIRETGNGPIIFPASMAQTDPVDLTSVLLTFWPDLTESGFTYILEVNSQVRGAGGELAGVTNFGTLESLDLSTPIITSGDEEELGRDLAVDPFTGTFEVVDGHYKTHKGIEYLKKRIFRRIETAAGQFFHLPDYGAGLPLKLKKLGTSAEVRSLRFEIERQVKLEDGVEDARVTLKQENTGILKISLQVLLFWLAHKVIDIAVEVLSHHIAHF